MKERLNLMFVLLFFALASFAQAAPSFSPLDFQYKASINGAVQTNKLYKVHLSAEILQNCSYACKDLRIFDSNNTEIPYMIIENKLPVKTSETYALEIINYNEKKQTSQITMKLSEKHEPISSISVQIADRDFKKDIALYGSNDMKKWSLLIKDAIYDFSSQIDLRKTEIKFKKSPYRYYQMEITDSKAKTNSKETISLKFDGLDFTSTKLTEKKIRISKITGKTLPVENTGSVYDETAIKNLLLSQDKDNNTVIFFSTTLPFEKITLKTYDFYYHRKVIIYSSPDGKENSYRFITQGYIFQFPPSKLSETKKHIENAQSGQTFYKIIIENRNNPPLRIDSITLSWIQRNLYLLAGQKVQPYMLCVGNKNAEKPEYDLANFINQNNWFKHTPTNLETPQIQLNADYKPAMAKDTKTMIEKTILTIVVIILVIAIGFWIYFLISKTSAKNQ